MVITNRSAKAESRTAFVDTKNTDGTKPNGASISSSEENTGPQHGAVYTVDAGDEWPILEILKWISFAILTVIAILVLYNYYTMSSANRMRSSGADGVLKSSGMSPEERRKSEEHIKKLSKRIWKNTEEESQKPKQRKPIVQELDVSKLPLLQRPIPPSDVDRPHILDLLSGEKLLRLGWHKDALEKFDEILKLSPHSPRAHFGAGEAKCSLAEEQQSMKLLDECMDLHKTVCNSKLAPKDLQIESAGKLLKSATFSGRVENRIWAAEQLYRLQPDSPQAANQLSFHYLSTSKLSQGKKHLEQVLTKWPENAVAKAHMGRVLIFEGKVDEGIQAIMQGIEKADIIRKDPTFYNLVGDALTKMDRKVESDNLFKMAAENKVFPSQWQRPQIYEQNLKAKPFWTPQDLPGYSASLERIQNQLSNLRREALQILEEDPSLFKSENPAVVKTGTWKTFTLYSKGKKDKNCALVPKTSALLSMFPDATKCKHGQIKFGLLSPNTEMWPHVSKANTKLRVIFTLEESPGAVVKVAEETKSLSATSPLIFDNSFEHQLMNKGETLWLGLIIDVWHPDLSEKKRSALKPF